MTMRRLGAQSSVVKCTLFSTLVSGDIEVTCHGDSSFPPFTLFIFFLTSDVDRVTVTTCAVERDEERFLLVVAEDTFLVTALFPVKEVS